MTYLDWIQNKRDHLEETALWDSHQLRALKGSMINIQATLSLNSFTNKKCFLYETDLNRFLILCFQQPVAVRTKDRQPCRTWLRAVGSLQTNTVSAMCWTGKPSLPVTGKHTSHKHSNRYKKSFLYLPSFPWKWKVGRACASGDNAASHESFRAARAGKGAGGEQQCLSLACRDGTRLNKARTTRNTMSAAIAKATAPDNPSWKHPHLVPNRNACPQKM